MPTDNLFFSEIDWENEAEIDSKQIILILSTSKEEKAEVAQQIENRFNQLSENLTLSIVQKKILLSLAINLIIYFSEKENQTPVGQQKKDYYHSKVTSLYDDIINDNSLLDSQKAKWNLILGNCYELSKLYNFSLFYYRKSLALLKSLPKNSLIDQEIEDCKISVCRTHFESSIYHQKNDSTPDLMINHCLASLKIANQLLATKNIKSDTKIYFYKSNMEIILINNFIKNNKFYEAFFLMEAFMTNATIFSKVVEKQKTFLKNFKYCALKLPELLNKLPNNTEINEKLTLLSTALKKLLLNSKIRENNLQEIVGECLYQLENKIFQPIFFNNSTSLSQTQPVSKNSLHPS